MLNLSIPFTKRQLFRDRRIEDAKSHGTPFMKQIVPLVLALIPLAAVVGACVTCP